MAFTTGGAGVDRVPTEVGPAGAALLMAGGSGADGCAWVAGAGRGRVTVPCRVSPFVRFMIWAQACERSLAAYVCSSLKQIKSPGCRRRPSGSCGRMMASMECSWMMTQAGSRSHLLISLRSVVILPSSALSLMANVVPAVAAVGRLGEG